MHPFSLSDMISQAIGEVMVRSDIFRCVFIDTETPRYIKKIKQGIVLFSKRRKDIVRGRRLVSYNRMICSRRITDSRSVLA